ncbi:MAG: hypothetical protein HYY51_03390 [Candidatus Magasanikbacteria bacterium]|nr:hypothetical protein [Candidatus Magasanikbacteria bacterium]
MQKHSTVPSHRSNEIALNERKHKLLGLVIDQYIETTQPVGSKLLSGEAEVDLSAATIRNEMRELEEAGLLVQPHTSAGRVPTDKGYKYYVEHILEKTELPAVQRKAIRHIADKITDRKDRFKRMGHYVAEEVQSAVIIAFNRDTLYYTGIAHLFGQPEFRDYAFTLSMSSMFDHCEHTVDSLYEMPKDQEPRVLIGHENPFGDNCGAVSIFCPQQTLFAILGPLRMKYRRGLELLRYIQEII